MDVVQVQTKWGPIGVSWIASGPGQGEIHIKHEGTLRDHEIHLEKLVTSMKGRSKSLSEEFWVVVLHDKRKATEATATAFAQAIANLASRETDRADKKASKATDSRR